MVCAFDEDLVERRVMGIEVEGRRRRGKTKRRWVDSVKADLGEKGLLVEDVHDRM